MFGGQFFVLPNHNDAHHPLHTSNSDMKRITVICLTELVGLIHGISSNIFHSVKRVTGFSQQAVKFVNDMNILTIINGDRDINPGMVTFFNVTCCMPIFILAGIFVSSVSLKAGWKIGGMGGRVPQTETSLIPIRLSWMYRQV